MRNLISRFIDIQEEADRLSPAWYHRFRRKMTILFLVITLVPLFLMATINYYLYQTELETEIVTPLKAMINKTKHSFEMFLAERASAVSFIASAYPFEDLANQKTLNRIFQAMRRSFSGFIDLGLIDQGGRQITYVGPYPLKDKEYADQAWFHEVRLQGKYISDVFMGYRMFPHFVIAVQHEEPDGQFWVLRATLDTATFNNLIASMGLDASTDAFILNREGVFQTPSKFYGQVLDMWPLEALPVSQEPTNLETRDHHGRRVLLVYTDATTLPFRLVLVKQHSEALKTWIALRGEIFLVFIGGVILIWVVVVTLMGIMVRRIEESDRKRELAYHEVEYSNKLASIGRLAAGVAHEINNPLAIINEKAGLMKDLMNMDGVVDKDRFQKLTDAVLNSVERCRAITHRLLGFARRMDVTIETIDLNHLLREVFSFLEKEAEHRNLVVSMDLSEDVPPILSDRGQLQQVFLNILNNAFDAVKDGGQVTIQSRPVHPNLVVVSIMDNGAGMSEETMKHIFEPFFSTKKGYGTGLGLSITYGIIQKLGGKIEVESHLGEGTVFRVLLPVNRQEGGE